MRNDVGTTARVCGLLPVCCSVATARCLAEDAVSKLVLPCPPRASSFPALRVAYLSHDFRDHPTGWMVLGMFAAHRRDRVHASAYYHGPLPTDVAADHAPPRSVCDAPTPADASITRRIACAADEFHAVAGHTDDAVGRAMAQRGEDILVDLMALTQRARIRIPALRPARIVASYLGYPGTSGTKRGSSYGRGPHTHFAVGPGTTALQLSFVDHCPWAHASLAGCRLYLRARACVGVLLRVGGGTCACVAGTAWQASPRWTLPWWTRVSWPWKGSPTAPASAQGEPRGSGAL